MMAVLWFWKHHSLDFIGDYDSLEGAVGGAVFIEDNLHGSPEMIEEFVDGMVTRTVRGDELERLMTEESKRRERETYKFAPVPHPWQVLVLAPKELNAGTQKWVVHGTYVDQESARADADGLVAVMGSGRVRVESEL